MPSGKAVAGDGPHAATRLVCAHIIPTLPGFEYHPTNSRGNWVSSTTFRLFGLICKLVISQNTKLANKTIAL